MEQRRPRADPGTAVQGRTKYLGSPAQEACPERRDGVDDRYRMISPLRTAFVGCEAAVCHVPVAVTRVLSSVVVALYPSVSADIQRL